MVIWYKAKYLKNDLAHTYFDHTASTIPDLLAKTVLVIDTPVTEVHFHDSMVLQRGVITRIGTAGFFVFYLAIGYHTLSPLSFIKAKINAK